MSAAPSASGRILEAGLAIFLASAPLPFASVHARGRLAFECGAFVLLAIWAIRARSRPTPLPPRIVTAGLLGLAALALVHALPLGGVVTSLAPALAAERAALVPPAEIAAAERRLLGTDPSSFDRPASWSVDAPASASAARTASAYAAIALVAFTVASLRGPRGIALGLLVGGAFQALYGIAVLASGHDRIWTVPKAAYLDSATGTFVNRNHYAAYLALALAAGTGWLCARARESTGHGGATPGVRGFGEGRAGRSALGALAVAVVAAGLLVSFSRAGTTLGVAAFAVTIFVSGVPRSRGTRAIVLAVALAVAAVPLLSVGAAPLAERFAHAERDFLGPGGRATVWKDTVRLTAAHPWLGSGIGAFAAAYPPFRSPEVRSHYTHAHNDWLQTAAEGGIVALAFLLAILVPVVRRLPAAATGSLGPLAAGFAAGLAAFAAHAAIDFPARIPAVVAAALAAGAAVLAAKGPQAAPGRPVLRAVEPGDRAAPSPGRRAGILAAALVACGAVATALGAGDARDPEGPWRTSAAAAEAAIRGGPGDDTVRRTLREFRARLGARPFHAENRAAYAAVLLEAAFGTGDVSAAAFHAREAASRSPVSKPVVVTAVDVLLRSGDAEGALGWIREMFLWDARAAAEMLGRAEPFVRRDLVEGALPDDPEAWEARASSLSSGGRRDEARILRDRAFARWPDRPATRAAAADEALRRGDLEAFRRIVPLDLEVAPDRASVALLAHRARSKGLAGDLEGAEADAAAAARAGEGGAGALLRAGDALAAVGATPGARAYWVRALHASRSGPDRSMRIAALARIARLDEREGRAGEAFREWREVLSIDPGHAEARARVAWLSGGPS